MSHSNLPSSPSPRYAAAGDFMRVFCAFMIGWYHIWQQSWLTPTLRLGGLTLDFYPWVRAGYMFVDLMLLLSGFLLYLPWANGKPPETGVYLRRRAARILPGYWLALAVMLAFAVTAPDFDRPALLARDLGAHLAFIHNLFRFSYSQTRLNAVLWTLAVEVQFYLLLPALAPLFNRRPLLCWGAMTGIALSFRLLWTAPMPDTTMFVNRLPNMLDLYADGMLAAHLYAKLARRKDHRALIAALGTLLRIKPVLQIKGERLDAFSKARTINQGKNIMINAMKHDIDTLYGGTDRENVWLYAVHGNVPEAFAEFSQEVKAAFPAFHVEEDVLSLSIACHIGPGALAIACSKKIPFDKEQ